MVNAAMARTGGDKNSGEVQIAIAEADKMQDGEIVNKAMSATDAENDKAIA